MARLQLKNDLWEILDFAFLDKDGQPVFRSVSKGNTVLLHDGSNSECQAIADQYPLLDPRVSFIFDKDEEKAAKNGG
jgi:hypothetical protein